MFCPNCGKQIEKDFKVCPYCGQDLTKPTYDTTQTTESNSKENQSLTYKIGKTIMIIILSLFGLFLTFIGMYIVIEGGCSNNQSCASSQIIKAKPTISHEQTLTGVLVTINANDDYNFVLVEIQYLDKNNNVLQTEELIGYDYKEGNTYNLHSQISMSSIFNVTNYKCTLKSYG